MALKAPGERRGETLKTAFRLGAASLALLHLAKVFFPAMPAWLLSLAGVVVLIPGLFLISPGFKKATVVFLAAGVAILAATRQPPAAWLSAWNSMTNTIAIMVAMQVISIPVAMGGYDQAIRRWAERRFRSPGGLFIFSTLITHLFASVLIMGAIPLSMALLSATIAARVEESDRFLSAAVSRGYVLAAMWAPGAINLYLVVQATGVAWSAILLPGLLLACLGLALSCLMERKGGALEAARSAERPSEAPRPAGARSDGAALAAVLAAAAAIVGIVLALERMGIGAGYSRIMIAGCVVAAAWIGLIWNRERFKAAAATYWDEGMLKVRDMGPFFIAMGIFSGALESSGAVAAAMPAIQSAASWLGASAVVLLPLVIIGLSLVGFHPFITIVMFGKILSGAGIPQPPITIALSLALGGAAAYMISPFAGIIMSIARYTGAKASDIAIRWNWKFSLAFFALGVAFSFGWGALFG